VEGSGRQGSLASLPERKRQVVGSEYLPGSDTAKNAGPCPGSSQSRGETCEVSLA
jgi:hypothetical protein